MQTGEAKPFELSIKGRIAEMTSDGMMMRKTMPKKCYRSYFLTINTNKAYAEDDPHLKEDTERLYAFFYQLFSYPELYLKTMSGKPVEQHIEKVSPDFVVELGSKYHRLHMHALIAVEYRETEKVNVNIEKLREVVAEQLGISGFAVDVKTIKEHKAQLLAYLEKNVYSKNKV